jgi:hypothetical protein
LLALACWLPAVAPAATDHEATLQSIFERATWPGDIVRAADAYLRAYPQGSAADEVLRGRAQAAQTWHVVTRNDVRLFRSAFTPTPDNAAELRRAALGDRTAAVALAQASLDAGDEGRYEGWLQYAASLGDDRASYELALYYRRVGLAVLASRYEAHAVALGYEPANSLDNVRK